MNDTSTHLIRYSCFKDNVGGQGHGMLRIRSIRPSIRNYFCVDTSTAEIPQLFYLTLLVIVEVGGQAWANLWRVLECRGSLLCLLCAGAVCSGWFSEQLLVRHDDPVGKIQRLFSCWSWLQLWSFSQATEEAACLLFHWLLFGNTGNTGIVPSHHPLSAGRVVLGRDGSSSLPPQYCSAPGCRRNQEPHLLSGRNRDN